MKYLTITELARKWGLTERRIAQMCNEGGPLHDVAMKQGKFWLIPDNVERPADGRSVQGGSIAAQKRAAESMRNNVFGEDSLLALRNIEPESVDLIMAELPRPADGSGRKQLSMGRVWSEYHRIIKPAGYVVLLSSGAFTAQIIDSNPNEFLYKLVWVKNSEEARKSDLGSSHMDVCVFSYKGQGFQREGNIASGIKEGLFNTDSQSRDMLRFCDEDGEMFKDDAADKTALGSYLACAYADEGDFVVDNAAFKGSLIAGAMFAGRNICCIEKDAQREDSAEDEGKAFMGVPGDVAFSGTPSSIAKKYGGMKLRTVTEYYSNICWLSLFNAWRRMPQERRALLQSSDMIEAFARAEAEKG